MISLFGMRFFRTFLVPNSVEAEALAMCLLLKTTIKLSILSLEVCTNCDLFARVVQGDMVYQSNEMKESLWKLYHLLSVMVGYFEELLCRWCSRDNIVFVDSLIRSTSTFKNASKDK